MIRKILMLIFWPVSTMAHPGWGLQVDSDNQVYFTDLHQVYIVSPQGETQVLVPDVHSHALYLDNEGFLVGDHSWVDSQGRHHSSWWRIDQEGVRVELPEFKAAELFGMLGPMRERLVLRSNVHEQRAEFIRLGENGEHQIVGGGEIASVDGSLRDARFGVLGAQIRDGAGGLLLTSGSQLRSIDSRGQVTTLLGEAQGFPLLAEHRSSLLGLAVEEDGNVLVADLGGRQLIRLEVGSGEISQVLRAGWRWQIAGVAESKGDIYILEFGRLPLSRQVRVRRIDRQGDVHFVADSLLE